MTIDTNKAIVTAVSESGCVCAVNGANRQITWDALREAASQESKDLAAIYQAIQNEARKMVERNHALPVTYSVHQDESNVWWVATFTDVAGEWSWIPRAAHEGGTLAHRWQAEAEAKERAERLRRLGFNVYPKV